MTAGSGCPNAQELLRWLDKRGDPATRDHVQGCTSCQLAVSAFARTASDEQHEDSVVAWVEQIQRRIRSSLSPGSKLGRYEIVRCAGVGGMGVVYEAHDPELDRRVAIKRMHPSRTGDGERRRLLREARALAKLSHPNVVSVFDVGDDHGQVFIAMEYVAGETLRDWLDNTGETGAPNRSRILDMFAQAGRGLAAAHACGLVHRDFKPDNVLIGADGRARVTDFGLARSHVASETEDVTVSGVMVGTPTYMAPEVRRGDEADARSDQFSFGVALYRALHGHAPRTDVPLMEGAALLGWRSRRLLRRALSGDPAKRFESMDVLLRELDRCRRSGSRRWLAAAAIAVLGAAGVGLWMSGGAGRATASSGAMVRSLTIADQPTAWPSTTTNTASPEPPPDLPPTPAARPTPPAHSSSGATPPPDPLSRF